MATTTFLNPYLYYHDGAYCEKCKMKKVVIYTDGACQGNPGPGGWGVLLRYNNREKTLSGAVQKTTNNRMELTAGINDLVATMEKKPVEKIRQEASKEPRSLASIRYRSVTS